MNIVLIIVTVILAIVVIILIAAAFSSKDYQIAREITIERPKHEVFDYIKLLKNQDYYSKWVMTDPNMRKEFRESTELLVLRMRGTAIANKWVKVNRKLKE